MQIYLVGGAVRDQLLQRPVKERDWVVVGSSEEELIHQGFQPVGKSFPVFLHPQTHEEYALARREYKSGKGYKGFICDVDQAVTLAEDLLRRDLTINAIAQDENGKLIDPYGGLNDLKLKRLRHVSPAFTEDPLRILRVARFAARYDDLGFQVAPETMVLMNEMVKGGELTYLTPERVWQEVARALLETKPSIFFSILYQCGALEVIMPELASLFGTPIHISTGELIDGGSHTLLAIDAAVNLHVSIEVSFATLCHTLLSSSTDKNIIPDSHPVLMVAERWRVPVVVKELALLNYNYHKKIHSLYHLSTDAILSVLMDCDSFRRPQRFASLLIACEAIAHDSATRFSYTQDWSTLLEQTRIISPQPWINEGLKGKALGQAIYQARLALIKQWQAKCKM